MNATNPATERPPTETKEQLGRQKAQEAVATGSVNPSSEFALQHLFDVLNYAMHTGSLRYRLGAAMMNLMAVAENYPQLKADQNFQQLQAELSDIENKIAAARRFFNSATNEYNTAVTQFPALLIARLFGFKEELFFELSDAEKSAVATPPNVKF